MNAAAVFLFVVSGLSLSGPFVVDCRPQFAPFQFPTFGFPQAQSSQTPFSPPQLPQFGQQQAAWSPFQFPTFGQAGQTPFSPFSFFPMSASAPASSPQNQAAVANLVAPKNDTGPQNLYPQLSQPAGRVPVSEADYLSRQNDAAKQTLMRKLAKYPDYPPPSVAAGQASVQYGGPPADMWGNFADEVFDRQTGQLLVPGPDQNPPPLISNPPSPDDVTQNF